MQGYFSELCSTEVSPTLIFAEIDAAIEDVEAWQSRTLESAYAIVYLDCIHIKVRNNDTAGVKAVYLALDINLTGEKKLLMY